MQHFKIRPTRFNLKIINYLLGENGTVNYYIFIKLILMCVFEHGDVIMISMYCFQYRLF